MSMVALSCGGQTPATQASKAGAPAQRAAAQCRTDLDCPIPENPCLEGVCAEGVCQALEVARGTRCPLNYEWAQRQADLFPIETNEQGVCRETMCMPRLLCMQYCGAEVASKIASIVEITPCPPGTHCDVKPDPVGVDVGRQGLRDCAIACGFPFVEPIAPKTGPSDRKNKSGAKNAVQAPER